jgi:hypothetical protein
VDHRFKPPETTLPEEQIRKACEAILVGHHNQLLPHDQLHCFAGEIDISTGGSIYETKVIKRQADLFQAVGQVLLYKACKPHCAAFLVCEFVPRLDRLGRWPPGHGKKGWCS